MLRCIMKGRRGRRSHLVVEPAVLREERSHGREHGAALRQRLPGTRDQTRPVEFFADRLAPSYVREVNEGAQLAWWLVCSRANAQG
jgi:hypothetical protein